MRRFITPIFLAVAGSIAMLIGAAILFVPHAFFASNQIVLEADPNLMSEIRAPGGLLLVAGLFVLVSGFVRRLTLAGLLVAAVGFGAYGGARLLSIAFDGLPSATLLFAMLLELVVALAAWALATRRRKASMTPSQGYAL